ncbi:MULTISPECIES: hypothetical protein [Marinobacter]|nr:hypothetical protein [Marinobacter sp. Arc7-DN-1]
MRRKDEGATRIRDLEAKEVRVNNIIYIVGAVVIVLVILSFVGIG